MAEGAADGELRGAEVRLLVQDLSTTELAPRLHLSETTIKTHVSRILAKLQLRDRVQAVVLACETGLIKAADRRGT